LIVNAATGNLKKVSLELGGKSPNIVFADADTKKASQGAASAIFFNHGQCCCAGSRLFVERASSTKLSRVCRTGQEHPRRPGTRSADANGPARLGGAARARDGVSRRRREEGARALAGGNRIGECGYFVEPTVLVDTHDDMKVVREEIFGPVITASPFDDLDDLARRATTVFMACGRHLDQRREQGARACVEAACGDGLDQLLHVFDAALPSAAISSQDGAVKWGMTF